MKTRLAISVAAVLLFPIALMSCGADLQGMDSNYNGKVEPEEATATGMLEDQFKQMDRNGDGQLTADELSDVKSTPTLADPSSSKTTEPGPTGATDTPPH